ncbi:4Fe-4S binding protein [bacterium]|nr:4Fe-4S binding protein [bacterium]
MIIFNKIWALIIGHITVFKHSFKKRVTLEYPEQKQVLPETFRGKPVWNCEKCIGCGICERVCPAAAVKVDKNNDNINSYFDLSRCIMCGNCMYYCPKHAIRLSSEYELATDNKNDLYIYFNKSEGV